MMANPKTGKFSEPMEQIYTSIPIKVADKVRKKADKDYIRPADIYRRIIVAGIKKELGE